MTITNYNQSIINQAKAMLVQECETNAFQASNPDSVKIFLQLELASLESECFAVMFLDNQHKLIAFEKLFFGTINACNVYPRIVLKRALAHNAAAVILSHNHPSGNEEPSLSDIDITQTIKTACRYVDILVLDHIIVSKTGTTSLSERGQV